VSQCVEGVWGEPGGSPDEFLGARAEVCLREGGPWGKQGFIRVKHGRVALREVLT
jgi:hypothetical protein